MASLGLPSALGVTAAGRRAGLGRAGGRRRSLPESARRDPLRPCGSAAGIGRPAWARVLGACGSVRLFRRPAGGIVARMAAVGIGTAGPGSVVHAVAAVRVVVRGRPGRLRRPAGGRIAAVRWGRKMFPQKVVAVGHGVNPDCVCMVSSGASSGLRAIIEFIAVRSPRSAGRLPRELPGCRAASSRRRG